MHTVVISSILTILISVSAWYLDQKFLECRTPVRAFFGLALLAIGTWICATIILAIAFKIPGAYGPVQYWGVDMEAHRFISGPRTIAFFAILGGILVAGLNVLVTVVTLMKKPRRGLYRKIVLPSIALTTYGLSWPLFIYCGFYPSA